MASYIVDSEILKKVILKIDSLFYLMHVTIFIEIIDIFKLGLQSHNFTIFSLRLFNLIV